MIHYIFEFTNIVLDTFVLIFFLTSMLGKRKCNMLLFVSVFIIVELIVSANSMLWGSITNLPKQIITISISVITTYICTLLFSAPTKYKISFTLIFMVLAALSEVGAYGLLGFFDIVKLVDEEYLYIYVLTVSKFLIFILTLIIRNVFSYSEEYRHSRYNYLLLITPVMSIIITMNLPHVSKASPKEFESTFLCIIMLIIINICNYFLFYHSVNYYSMLRKNRFLQQQMDYQRNNYSHIQESYRNTRKIIHETKNIYTVIEDYIIHQEYNRLLEYIYESRKHLDERTLIIQTGNIVLDSLLTNYLSIASNRKIPIKHKIAVDITHIKPNDYDLSIILGNLLDNAFNAVQSIDNNVDNMGIIDISIFTNDTSLVIHIENTIITSQESTHIIDSINHGFGIENVSKIVNKYDGNYTYGIENDSKYTATVIIPYDLTEDDFQHFIDKSIDVNK